MIIDFHTHTFPEEISEKVMRNLGRAGGIQPFTDGSIPGLLASMREAKVTCSVNLPVVTHPKQVWKINTQMISQKETLSAQGIVPFGGMHPDFPDARGELNRLKREGIAGIKLHPPYQSMDLDDIRMLRIIDQASNLGLINVIHAGIDIGIYDHNYSSVSHIIKVIEEVHPENFVLAHMGNWGCWREVESDLAGAPVWFDTAFSIGPITPYPNWNKKPYMDYNLPDEDFIRLVRKHGTNRILFATDSPWQNQKDYIQRIENMNLAGEEKERIFSKNALSLLGGRLS